MKVCEMEKVETDLLRAELERALGETWHACPRIAHLARQASSYRTSFPLEELQVSLDDGRHLPMVWKDLHRGSLHETARRAKPDFLHHPRREIETYRQILVPHHLSTATFYGAVVRPEKGRCWLFLERVEGRELYQIGDFEIWRQVARWLAGMHAQFRGRASAFQRSVPLLVYDRAFCQRWMARARQFAAGSESAGEVEWLARRHDKVVDRLLTLPRTLLHGEFYASNVLVAPQPGSLRVCPVDWELAAIGPGLMDLGALVAGSWSEEERRELARAYYLALEPAEGRAFAKSLDKTSDLTPGPFPAREGEIAMPLSLQERGKGRGQLRDSAKGLPQEGTFEELLEALDYCRLQIAVQWLGWSPDWSPPPEHAHNWLREAISLAEKLGL